MIRVFFTRNGTSVGRNSRCAIPGIARVCVGVAAMSALVAHAQLRLPEVRVEDTRTSPLNLDTPAQSGSLLGLTPRETPATLEIIDQTMIRNRGFRTTTEAAQGAVGVTAGDAPGAPGNFSMRGYSFGQINILYDGIRIGPASMTSRVMDTGNLERIEFLKGPASLMSGEGAAGGSVNYVTKRPHSGPIENDSYVSYGSFNTVRAGFGSGGSTSKEGLDYRIDVNRATSNGFIDDTRSQSWNVSTGLDYRVSGAFKLFGALEYRQDKSNAYWGTPLVSGAAAGVSATGGIVAGTSVASISGNNLGPVTIDNRTLTTNYNVIDNNNEANQIWLRGGFEWALNSNLLLRSQIYGFTVNRTFFNSETYSFDPASGLVDRDRFFVGHDQNMLGNKTQLQWDSTFAGKENRLVTAFEISNINFHVRQFDFTNAAFPADSVTLINPIRGTFGPLDVENFSTRVGDAAISFDDRLKVTPTFALIGGLRYEQITLDRNAPNRAGYPYSQSWWPLTGRLGFTWETIPGLTLYGQYATAADVAAANLFNLRPSQTQNLTTTRTYEGGVKQLFWERKAEWSLAGYHIERNNLPSQQSATVVNTVGQQISDGVEVAAAVRPNTRWNIWGNVSYMRAYYSDYITGNGSLSGNTPPNVPKVVANAGASYRMNLPVPIELGASVRHVGDRFNADPNAVTMLAYTVADAYAFMDIRKNARITLRVRNLTDKNYAIWADPGYPDQILLGAPRSYEISAALKF